MKTKQWLQIVTVASALAIAGTSSADDQNPIRMQERAGAAVNDNAPAQLGTNMNSNTAAQLGVDTPKTTVPSDVDATPPKADADATREESLKHPPTNRMDQATPTQKTPRDNGAAKHPPTARMDAATPTEKSPQ